MKKITAVFLAALNISVSEYTSAAERSWFDIDLSRPLPSYEELEKKYAVNRIYDRRYDFSWNIGRHFDDVFAQTIVTYGSGGKRLKKENEDKLLEMIKAAPPEIYPYIGPYLHTVPNMSPKILNMPGIKETKGKFPERIAPQMAEIPNLEFLSPYLYFLLIPEIWPENARAVENVPLPVNYPKVEHDAAFFQKIKKLVPAENFYPGRPSQTDVTASDLRTVSPTESSPLTSADIQAFSRTIPSINAFADQSGMRLNLFTAGIFLDAWENEQNGYAGVAALKDIVYPCRRLVQKVRILGKETEFKLLVGSEGFTPEEWAYTCDKTLNAYRVSKMSAATAASVKNYRSGMYKQALSLVGGDVGRGNFLGMEAFILMYKAPLSDVLEVMKNRRELNREFADGKYLLGGQPLSLSQ